MAAKNAAQDVRKSFFTPVPAGTVERKVRATSPEMTAMETEIQALYDTGMEGSIDLPGSAVASTLTLARRAAARVGLGLDTGIKDHATGARVAPKNVVEDDTMYRVSIAPRVKIDKPRKTADAE